jgi:hypothetical protein
MPIVYILTNAAMPDLVKIGRTDGPIEERVRQLNAVPGVPLPFEVFFAAEVEDSIGWERAMHEAFADRRVNPRREFFRLSPDKPMAILRMAHARNVTPAQDIVETPEELDALERARSRRSVFSFVRANVPVGAELVSVFDDQAKSTVANERWIMFEGEETSLSAAAKTVAHRTGRNWSSVAGPDFWTFEGETLSQRRQRLEEDDSSDG